MAFTLSAPSADLDPGSSMSASASLEVLDMHRSEPLLFHDDGVISVGSLSEEDDRNHGDDGGTPPPSVPEAAAYPPAFVEGDTKWRCPARNLGANHHSAVLRFANPAMLLAPHAQWHRAPMVCSAPSCRKSLRSFRWCAGCEIPVAQRNFSRLHDHHRLNNTSSPAAPQQPEHKSKVSTSKAPDDATAAVSGSGGDIGMNGEVRSSIDGEVNDGDLHPGMNSGPSNRCLYPGTNGGLHPGMSGAPNFNGGFHLGMNSGGAPNSTNGASRLNSSTHPGMSGAPNFNSGIHLGMNDGYYTSYYPGYYTSGDFVDGSPGQPGATQTVAQGGVGSGQPNFTQSAQGGGGTLYYAPELPAQPSKKRHSPDSHEPCSPRGGDHWAELEAAFSLLEIDKKIVAHARTAFMKGASGAAGAGGAGCEEPPHIALKRLIADTVASWANSTSLSCGGGGDLSIERSPAPAPCNTVAPGAPPVWGQPQSSGTPSGQPGGWAHPPYSAMPTMPPAHMGSWQPWLPTLQAPHPPMPPPQWPLPYPGPSPGAQFNAPA